MRFLIPRFGHHLYWWVANENGFSFVVVAHIIATCMFRTLENSTMAPMKKFLNTVGLLFSLTGASIAPAQNVEKSTIALPSDEQRAYLEHLAQSATRGLSPTMSMSVEIKKFLPTRSSSMQLRAAKL